jgi:hypothetical protein
MSPVPPSQEQLLRVLHEHWVKYIVPFFVAILLFGLSGLLFILAALSNHHSNVLAALAYMGSLSLLIFALHWFFIFLLSEASAHIIITNHRVVHLRARLFVRDDILNISYEKMKHIRAEKRGLLQNILRYGSLNFEGGATVHLVPHPNKAARDIEQAMGLS